MKGLMNGWNDGWMDERIHRWIDGRINEWMDV